MTDNIPATAATTTTAAATTTTTTTTLAVFSYKNKTPFQSRIIQFCDCALRILQNVCISISVLNPIKYRRLCCLTED